MRNQLTLLSVNYLNKVHGNKIQLKIRKMYLMKTYDCEKCPAYHTCLKSSGKLSKINLSSVYLSFAGFSVLIPIIITFVYATA